MIDVVIIAILIVLNGLLALSELAVVSSRRSRLKLLVERGRHGSRRALELANNPGRFLSTVQIGITLVGIIAGAYSGATYGEALAARLQALGLAEQVAEPFGFGAVVLVITYLSLVIGELLPKQLALRNAEAIACMVAPAMTRMSRVASPLVSLLDASTTILLRLLGKTTEPEGKVTEEEIRTLIAEAESAGVLEADERRMMVGVLRLGDRPVQGIMTPRTEVVWINAAESPDEIREVLMHATHSLLPVGEDSIDAMIGVVEAREILAAILHGRTLDIREHVRSAPIVPDIMDALDVIAKLRDAKVQMALVHDEYGHFEGLVTPADILEAISGFAPGEPAIEPKAVRREGGSWLLSGWMPADEMAELLALELPEHRDYHTVAGFVLQQLGHLPVVGETCAQQGWLFEVVDLDGRRIDKVMAQREGMGRASAGRNVL